MDDAINDASSYDPNRRLIVMTDTFVTHQGYSNNVYYSFTLLHEISHFFGTVDHYCTPHRDVCTNLNCDYHHKKPGQLRNCIVSNKLDLFSFNGGIDMFCEDCQRTIENFIEAHN